MMDIEKFYRDAEHGKMIDEEEMREYINSYDTVIIWGAGNLGTALGKVLLEKGFQIDGYWDEKWQEKQFCNDIPVTEAFQGDYQKDRTLIIVGIVNGTRSHLWQGGKLAQKGYEHYLLGMPLYEGLVCPMHIGKPLDVKNCVQTSICNFNTCKKYMNILKSNITDRKPEDVISIQVLEFILSRRCTLDCIHCGQQVGYIKRKFPEKYVDYPLERIKKDIDIAMDNIDIVGTFSIIGGEPFIHPHIYDIVEHCLTKKNVAIISITTNGICKMDEEGLKRICSDRVKINFSNYTQSLGDTEKHLFMENLEKVRKAGIYENNATPYWGSVSNELRENPDFSAERLIAQRDSCVLGPSIANGKFYACPQTEFYSQSELQDVAGDVIDLTEDIDNRDMRQEIKELLSRPHYKACGYRCTNSKTTGDVAPGEQYVK